MAVFTTIAAGIGLASTAVGTGMSFAQAKKQKEIARRAEKKAAENMAKARARLEVNYASAFSVQKEPYELQREAEMAGTAQLIDAASESERGVAPTAGRVLALSQRGQGRIRASMADELSDIEAMKIEEDSRNRDINTQLDLGEVAGYQQEMAEAREAELIAKNRAAQGTVDFFSQAVSMVPTFGKFGTHNNQLTDIGSGETPQNTEVINKNEIVDDGFENNSFANPFIVRPPKRRKSLFVDPNARTIGGFR